MMLEKSNPYRDYLLMFIHEVTIVCPQCKKMAYVLTPEYTFASPTYSKLVCYSCKHFEHKHMVHNLYFYTSRFLKMIGQNVIIIGAPIDPFFHQPVWYRKKTTDKEVWCYNGDHMKDLHVNLNLLKIRKPQGKETRAFINRRVPKWMRESVSNRNKALEIIEGWFREGFGSRQTTPEITFSKKGKLTRSNKKGY